MKTDKKLSKIAKKTPTEFKKMLELVNEFPIKRSPYFSSSNKNNWEVYKDSKQIDESLIDQKSWHSTY